MLLARRGSTIYFRYVKVNTTRFKPALTSRVGKNSGDFDGVSAVHFILYYADSSRANICVRGTQDFGMIAPL